MFTDWDLTYSGNDNVGHECTFLSQKYPFNLRSLTLSIRTGEGKLHFIVILPRMRA